MGNGLHAGFEHPEILDQVRGGKIEVSACVDEVFRYDSPVQLTSRIARTDDASVGDHQVSRGSEIMLLIGAANRDPARFESPEFDPTRPDNAPPSFGAGIHSCLGHSLPRLAVKIGF